MELHLGLWLWLWLWLAQRGSVCAGLQHPLLTGEASHQLIRRPRGFPAAEVWCRLHGGSLLRSWDKHAKGFLQRNLDSGSKSWIGPTAQVPREQEEARSQGQPSDCNSILRIGDQFWARKEACSEKLSFICQPGLRRLRRVSTPQRRRHPCTVRCGPRGRTRTTPGLTREPVTAPRSFQPGAVSHQQANSPADTSSAPWPPTAPPATGMQDTPRTRLQSSPYPPLAPYGETSAVPEAAVPPGPGPSTQAQPTSTATSKGTGSLQPHPTEGSATLSPQDVLPEDRGQALEQLLGQFNQTVQTLGHPLAVERASQALQNLTSSPALLSGNDQAQASHALLFLSSHLPTEPMAGNHSSAGSAAAAVALFQTLSNLLVTMGDNASSSGGSEQQQRAALLDTLAALPLVQSGLFLGGSSSKPCVTVDSPALSTILSSLGTASLPHSSFHLPQPKPLTVTFPSASSLSPLLLQHSQTPLQLQVASFALDPFRPLGGKPMASVASIALRAGEGPVDMHGLSEEIEIVLGGQGEAAGSATQLNGTRHFSMEVNITSSEEALLVSVRPAAALQISLRLESPLQSQGNSCLLNTTLPKGRWQDDGAYVWVVPPENLCRGQGTYFLSAEVAPHLRAQGDLSVSIASTGCYYWASQHQAWRSDGCRVGPQSTLRSTQCLCDHLSFFGRFLLILPHTINLQLTGQLLSKVGQNPVGLALLCSLLLAYGALLFWARQRQEQDIAKVRVTVLGDNDASAHFYYLVQVFTGYRRGAATSAKVLLTLYGAEGQSEPRLLQQPQTPGFEKGSMDAFLLATRKHLGNLHAIRLWHNNSGSSPSWFVRRLVVSDLTGRRKWHFLCDCWLAVDMDDGQADRVFVPASDQELLSFGNLFWGGLVDKLTQEHLWLSVVTCSPWSPFTRVQRLSCCLALLLCSMLVNIMFWKGPEEEGHVPEPGPFVVTWQEVVVSMESALLLMPLHLLVMRIFQVVQPPAQEPPPPPPVDTTLPQPERTPSQHLSPLTPIQQLLTETVGFLYKNPLCHRREPAEFPGIWKQMPELVVGLCGLIRSYLQQLEETETSAQAPSCSLLSYLGHVVRDLEAQLHSLDWHHFQSPSGHCRAMGQLQQLRQQLEQQNPCPGVEPPSRPSSFPTEAPMEKSGPCSSGGLPRRFQFICWLNLGAVGLASGFFTVLYSLQLSRVQATHWVTSMVLSVLQGIFFMQPLKVVALTLIFSLMRRRQLWQDKGQEQELQRALALVGHLCPAPPGARGWAAEGIYRPPPLKPAVQPKGRALREKKLYSLAREIVVQLVFLAVLMVLCYAERSPNEFYLNDALQKSFARQAGNIQTLEHLYGWAKDTLLPGIYHDSEGFATGGNSFLVGSVRLRQIRAKVGPEKPGPAFLRPPEEPYTASQEDRGCFGPNWGPADPHDRAWVYQSETALQESPVWGQLAIYPGGGYLADLGPNVTHANSILHVLARDKWLDRCTRAIFVEFTVYNANVNLFCAVTVMLETNGIGAFTSSAALQILRLYPNSQMLVQLACAQIVFLLLLLYSIVVQGRRLTEQRWKYFSSKRNLLDALSVLISLTVVGLYVKRGVLAVGVLRRLRRDRSSFVRFSEMAKADAALTYLIAFLVALTTIQLWNLLRLNPRMHLITRTLQAAWDEILGFLLTLLVLLVGYAFACNLLFGWSIFNYKTFFDSVVTIVGLLVGIFNYEAVVTLDPVLGSLLIATSVLSMVFVIINLFVSALLTIFSREMKAVKGSKEESMMQLIQLKISILFGIKRWVPVPAQDGAAQDWLPPPQTSADSARSSAARPH